MQQFTKDKMMDVNGRKKESVMTILNMTIIESKQKRTTNKLIKWPEVGVAIDLKGIVSLIGLILDAPQNRINSKKTTCSIAGPIINYAS